MASKRDLLKKQAAKNEVNRGAESVLTVAGEDLKKQPETHIVVEEKITDVPNTTLDSLATSIEKETTPKLPDKEDTISISEERKETPKEIPAIKEEKIVISQTSAVPDKNFGMRLESNLDVDFLNFYPLQLGLTKKAYFLQIMEEAIKLSNTEEIDFSDPLIKKFIKGGAAELRTKNITIAIPENIIPEIKRAGAKYHMISQRFVAYIVQRNRLNATDYN